MWLTQAFELCYIEARRAITDIMEIDELGFWQRIPEKRCVRYQLLNCVTMMLKGLFIIEIQCKTKNVQKPNPRR